jgi:probable HAF family extracellular repeat protein
MRRTAMTKLALMALAVSAAGAARPARAEILYSRKDLGTLGGDTSAAFAVNDSGQVTGGSNTAGGMLAHAFLSGPGGGPLKDLGTLGGSGSIATAVNASGQVAGSSSTVSPGSLVSGATHSRITGYAFDGRTSTRCTPGRTQL